VSDHPPLRLAVVGCGAVARLYHLPAVAEADDVELVALVDPALERARALAASSGAAHALGNVDALAGLVDAAIVATPNRLHAPVATSLLEAGIHVLVEKPLARTTAECDAIAAASAAAGRVVAVGHDFRWFPLAHFARSLFASGMLGQVGHVDLQQSQTGSWPSETTSAFSREESGGGVLIDFGVHMVDLLAWWLGDPRVVAYRDDSAGGVETECEVDLELPEGGTGRIVLSRRRELRDTFVVRCERATVEIGIFEPATLRITLADGGRLDGNVPSPDFARAPLRWVFGRQLRDFADAVRSGTEPLVTLADGRRAVTFVEACYGVRTPLRHPWDWPEALAAVQERS